MVLWSIYVSLLDSVRLNSMIWQNWYDFIQNIITKFTTPLMLMRKLVSFLFTFKMCNIQPRPMNSSNLSRIKVFSEKYKSTTSSVQKIYFFRFYQIITRGCLHFFCKLDSVKRMVFEGLNWLYFLRSLVHRRSNQCSCSYSTRVP